MGFQIPPTLPDYKKLRMVLNNSDVQGWNPQIYDILSRLIDAVSQSQDVISNKLTPTPITKSSEPSCCDSAGIPPPPPGTIDLLRPYTVSGIFNIPVLQFVLPIIGGTPGYVLYPILFSLTASSNGKNFQNGANGPILQYSDGTTIGGSVLSCGLASSPPARFTQTSSVPGVDYAKIGLGINLVMPFPGISPFYAPPNDGRGMGSWSFNYMWVPA